MNKTKIWPVAMACLAFYGLLFTTLPRFAMADENPWTATFNPVTDATGQYDAFGWNWSGVAGQAITATVTNDSISGWLPVMRLSKQKTSGVVLQSTGTVSTVSNMVFSLVNSNIPPIGTYYSEFAVVSNGVWKTVAQGSVNVYASLFGTTNWAAFTPRVDSAETDPIWTAAKSGYATTVALASTGAAITVAVSNHNVDATAHAPLFGGKLGTGDVAVSSAYATNAGTAANWTGADGKLGAIGSNDIVVVIGDSLSSAASGKWPNILAARYPNSTWINNATGGMSVATMTNDVSGYLDPHYDSNKVCRAIFLGSGQNDTNGWDTFSSMCTNLAGLVVAKGWQLSVVEMYNWNATTWTSKTPRINRKLRDAADKIGYVYISGVAAAINDQSTQYLKTSLNLGDGHLNAAGQSILAEVIDRALRTNEKQNQAGPAYYSADKTVVAGSVRLPYGEVSLESGDLEGAAYSPNEVTKTAVLRASGYIGRKATARVVGSDGTNSYAIYTNAYADVAYVAANQVAEIATGAHAGVYKITAVGSVSATNAPLTGALPGDTLITFGGVVNTNAVENGIVVRQGRVIGKVLSDGVFQWGSLDVDVASAMSGGAGEGGKWLASIQRSSGSIGATTNLWACRGATSSRFQMTTYVSAVSNLYICATGDNTSQYVGYGGRYLVGRGQLTHFGSMKLRLATEVEE